jgi:hypothetical protein
MSDDTPSLQFVNIDKIRLENGQNNSIIISSMLNGNSGVEMLDEMIIAYDTPSNIPYVLIGFFTKYIVDNYEIEAKLVSAAYTSNVKVTPQLSKHGYNVYRSYYDFSVDDTNKVTFFVKVYFPDETYRSAIYDSLDSVDKTLKG